MKTLKQFVTFSFTLMLFIINSNNLNAQCNAGNTITTFPRTFDFESGDQNWNRSVAGDDFNWSRRNSRTPSFGTGESPGTNGPNFLYIEATGRSHQDVAFLDSPCFDLTTATNPEIHFDYNMFDSNTGQMGSLTVEVSSDNGVTYTDTGFILSLNKGSNWKTASINLSSYIGQTIQLRFVGTRGTDYRSDICLDNITIYDNAPSGTCTNTVTTFPYTESFESSGGSLGLWEQGTGDDENWTIRTGGTPTNNTGPLGAADGSYYLYTEASDFSDYDAAFLDSPCFDLTGVSDPEFSFSYHRYGSSSGGTVYIGPLTVQISTNQGITFNDLLILTGEQHRSNFQPWTEETIDLSAFAGQIIQLRFIGERLNASFSDISIDNMSLVNNPPLPEMAVLGNLLEIASGDTTPSTLDDTDFEDAGIATGTGVTKTFIIENSGLLDLTLNGVPLVEITGSTDFTVTTPPSSTITPAGFTSFSIEFMASAGAPGIRTATVSIANTDSDENPYTFNIQGNAVTPSPEIEILGNSVEIVSGDSTPDVSDDTDFGDVGNGFTQSKSFIIRNTGTQTLNLTDGSPHILIGGTDASLFSVSISDIPSNVIAPGSAASFTIDFSPTSLGIKNATISIANDDSDEDPYTFDIRGNCVNPDPEITITGNSTEIIDGSVATGTADNTDFGNVAFGSQVDKQFYIENDGAGFLTLTGAPHITLSNNTDFFISVDPESIINPSEKSLFIIAFRPTLPLGTKSTIVTVTSDDADEATYTFTITGECVNSYTEAPGGVTSALNLWLKGNEGLINPSSNPVSDGDGVSRWRTQAAGSDARARFPGQEPTYKDNAIDNINFNPVVDFDNDRSSVRPDPSRTYNDASTQFLYGDSGFYSQDMFLVVVPDETITSSSTPMYVFCGARNPTSSSSDATGISFGSTTVRLDDEVISLLEGSSSSTLRNGYGVALNTPGASFSQPAIINSRSNVAGTQQELFSNAINIETVQNDVSDFSDLAGANNATYFLGRHKTVNALTDARIAEVITYSSRKSDASNNDERHRIMSYLGIKYGITLGVNGTSQDYVDSNGSIIWNSTSAPNTYNYNIAGIGRDDNSGLYQKQSKSINTNIDVVGETAGILTMGLTDIYDTNSLNPSTCPDRTFLTWGDDNGGLLVGSVLINVDLSSGITGVTTPVEFTGIQRSWKVVESGGNMPEVKVRIPQNAIRNITPPGEYIMLVSDTPIFNKNADFKILRPVAGGQFEASYDFNGVKYITFGYAPKITEPRSIYFDGTDDYVAMDNVLNINPAGYTISAWIKTDYQAATGDMSILSKRDDAYTNGFDFRINSSRNLEISWGPSGSNRLSGSTTIPNDSWHHVAVIYSPGSFGDNTKLYIDGVEEATRNFAAPPISTNNNFRIAAAGNTTISSYFRGRIEEVRLWNTDISLDQLRYIMNQEIEQYGINANGRILPQSISKNDINPINWSELSAYYPMNTYIYTNIDDESSNAFTGTLMNLNTVDRQTAPLPYQSTAAGDWSDSATWLNGGMQTIPGAASIADPSVTIDWNIVRTDNLITMDNTGLADNTRSLLGLIVNSNTLEVEGTTAANGTGTGNAVSISHYFRLDGKLDLQGESQLLQGVDSDFDALSSGILERDQQGTQDMFTYNFWSSPVGSTHNGTYSVGDILRDGTNPAIPEPITFIGGYNGKPGPPIELAEFWIWKYADRGGSYSEWQHMQSTGTMNPGEGFTMKGVADTDGAVALNQNYVFQGVPYNGDYSLTIAGDNDYLVGNPYPSAMDADEFIDDNTSTTGTLYFWEHWGGDTHSTKGYQGGYAQYNKSSGTPAVSHPDANQTGTGTKTPGQYIPVGQGFFVSANATGGTIQFNNSQRVFVKESDGNSIFVRKAKLDKRPKYRIAFTSVEGSKRQLLTTVDPKATYGIDWGYDAEDFDNFENDMYWMIDKKKFIIQGVDKIDKNSVLPVGIVSNKDGVVKIEIDQLENVDNNRKVFVHDKETNMYHNLKINAFNVYLTAGEYYDRFEITFKESFTLSNNDVVQSEMATYYNNDNNAIIINNSELKAITSVKLFNVLGQETATFNTIDDSDYIQLETKKLSSGVYTIEIKYEKETITKKVLVK